MGKIVLLDDLTINQIAAGEVIERPASVVKEMVENSIDAGAKNITVEIKNGGISLIKITDDGCGMAEDDMEIAFERHATSKIRKAEDLEEVTTMGFRGEALASIAAIANVEMISKRAEDETGHRIVIEGGNILEKSEVGCPVGTTITVRNLFFNTPVRYKFLKKDFTESGYIEDAITRIALVNKDVSLKLINSGKTIIQTNGNGDSKTVIYSIFGKDIANGIMDVDFTYEDMKVTGVVGKAEIARNNRTYQHFFVNNRYVKDKSLSAAVDQAYKGLVPGGKFGFVILNIEMDPRKVDVNVHPAKLEVRFEEEGKVFKAIFHAIKSGLAKGELIENINRPINLETENVNKTSEDIIQTVGKEESSEENIETKDNAEEIEIPKTNAFTGFFKRLLKEPEETKEELENNQLREIFEYRKSAKERLFEDISRTKAEEKKLEETRSLNTEEVRKLEAATTTANDETMVIDSAKIAEGLVNSETMVVDSVKVRETLTLGETMEVDSAEVVEKLASETITIDNETAQKLKETLVNQETMKLESTKNIELPKTEVIDTLGKLKQEDGEDVVSNEESTEASVQNIDNVTEAILKLKIEADIDDTQMIDTGKVREALNEAKEEIPVNPEFANMYKKVFGSEVVSIRKQKEEEEEKINFSGAFKTAEDNLSVFEEEEVPELKYKLIGTVFSTYIIIEIKDEMYIIDQHAAHERIMYEKVKKNYYSEAEKDSQMLLLADIITLSHKEMSIARENIDMFKKAGFDFEEFGENTIKLVSVPSMCEELNTKKIFLEILDEIDTVAVTAKQEKEDKFIATVACKAAVKGNMKLDNREVETLLNKLLCLPNPFTCPHGRPTAVKITKNDLEKKFSRR